MKAQWNLKNEYRTTTIIAVAIMSSLLIYVVLVELIKHGYLPIARSSPAPMGQMKEGFLGMALLALVAVRASRNRILKKSSADNAGTLANKLKIATILTFAISEIPAILGLVLFLKGGADEDFYVLLIFSLLLMVLYFPRYRHWKAWIGTAASFY